MKMLLDCDVLLDVYLAREPHVSASSQLMDWAEEHPGRCCIAWHTASNLDFILKGGARAQIEGLLDYVDVPATGGKALRDALQYQMNDFEDAMQVAAATVAGAQLIVTRNTRDFRKSPIKAMSPAEILPLLESGSL